MKKIDTYTYVSMLKELAEEGKEVRMVISGSSMSPFLEQERDSIFFTAPQRPLKKGDIVFYQRPSGQYVVHRICRVCPGGYEIAGDGQTELERGVKPEQIFAVVTKVERKGKILKQGSFWWEFFAHIWIYVIPFRRKIMKIYAAMRRTTARKRNSQNR